MLCIIKNFNSLLWKCISQETKEINLVRQRERETVQGNWGLETPQNKTENIHIFLVRACFSEWIIKWILPSQREQEELGKNAVLPALF